MSVKRRIDKNKIYVAGRAGELVDYADPLTFSLLEKIFGYAGPYRKVLSLLGVGDRLNKKSFLVNIYGRVYSDIEAESEVLWNLSLYKLIYNGESVQLKWSPFQRSFFQGLANFIKKTLREIFMFSNLDKYKRETEVRYQSVLKAVKKAQQRDSITVEEFLKLYEDVVFVAYLYDLVFKYNNQRALVKKSKGLQEYLEKYDSSSKPARSGVSTFSLGSSKEIGFKKQIFAYERIPDFKGKAPTSIKVEAKLQCFKNNLRLKTGVLLDLLSKSLKKKAARVGFAEFEFLTIDEIDKLENIKRGTVLKRIERRKRIYRLGQTKKLSGVIIGGRILAKRKEASALRYCGISCSSGVAEGVLQYIDDPQQEVEKPLVMFPNATPVFTQQFRKAGGLIFKVGSPLSHGAIVAREMRVPAIVLDVDEKKLKGRKFRLDGKNGTLEAC